VSESRRAALRTARRGDAYWTPERLRNAVPFGGKKATVSPSGHPKPRAASHPFGGYPSVGVLAMTNEQGVDGFCSASVVQSPGKSLVLSAAHCLNDDDRFKNFVFVPQYNNGSNPKPFGIFPVKPGHVYLDDRYLSLGTRAGDDYDFAFIEVGANSSGQLLQDAVGGGNRLKLLGANDFIQPNVHLVGYPGAGNTPLDCVATTSKFNTRFLKIKCDGYTGGTSGSPFLANFDGTNGDVIGVIGGYETGGRDPNESYSSWFDEDVKMLYDTAVRGGGTSTDAGIGGAGTWKHATDVTSGRFGLQNTSDLVVKWSDGEVTLYKGNGNKGFSREIQLMPPNTLWRNHAIEITAGDYTGSNAYDLLVRWSDGELTIYKDVDENQKLRSEIQLAAPNDRWKQAYQISTGKYGGNGWPDDLVVVWKDGRVTQFTDVDDKGLHAEKELTGANSTWTHAQAVTGGDFDGNGGSDDMLVRWSDGETTIYRDIAGQGLGAETQVLPPNGNWKEAKLVTAGSYSGSGPADDLLVIWSYGKVSLHPDVDLSGLHAEHVLVRP
jgi:V8-like Glu-specific endopeptidase